MFILATWIHCFVYISEGVVTRGIYPFCVHNFCFREHVTTGGTGCTLACSPLVGWFW